jgi:hypothetical protein
MFIPEVELAFSNSCTACCYICSPVHGGQNEPFMSQQVFDKCVERLKEISFTTIQTGGDGESLLNPIYLNSLRTLRREFPECTIVLYNNFSILEPGVADQLIDEHLIDRLYTRIDSLNPVIAQRCTGLDFDNVSSNIDYFLSKNKRIYFQINYSNIQDYYNKCRNVLGIDPVYWDSLLFDAPNDEFEAIQKRFAGASMFEKIKQSLWAERHNPNLKKEPDLKCGREYCFDSILYIWTDGDVGICGYDDGQDALIYGNIMKESIRELWHSKEKQNRIDMVHNRELKGYPCVNPKCCLFY